MPRGFMFRLQPVLDQRVRAEERAQQAFARAERERLELETSLREVQREIDETRDLVRRGLTGRASDPSAGFTASTGIAAARSAAGGILHLNVRARRAAMELAGSMKRLELARQELVRAMAARKAIDLLREKALDDFRRAQLRAEEAALDEMTVMRHGRFAGLSPGSHADVAVEVERTAE